MGNSLTDDLKQSKKRRKAQCFNCNKVLNTYAVSEEWILLCRGCFNPDDELQNLKPAHQKFVNNIAAGQNQTEAYRNAYPNASYRTAMVNGSNLLRNTKIAEAVRHRVNRSLAHLKTSPEEVLGSAVVQMRSSMDDVLNEEGSFSIEKARQTGAVDLLKKHKETVKTSYNTETKSIETTKTIEVEMLTNESGRKEVANYIGLENFAPKDAPDIQELARALFAYLLEKIPHLPKEKAIEAVVKKYPEADAANLLRD